MAEGMMAQALPLALGGRWEVTSAGTHGLEGNRAEPHAVQAMRSFDIDISGHRARQVSAQMVHQADWVLVMAQAHQRWLEDHMKMNAAGIHRLTAFGERPQARDIPDPYGGSLQTYLACADLIRQGVEEFTRYLMAGKGYPEDRMMLTDRQRLARLLGQESLSVRHLSQQLSLSEKEVTDHLIHIKRSQKNKTGRLTVTPARCRSCGFVFKDRHRFKRPGRCPRCRRSYIQAARFQIK
jgi:protein-tyrosine-phosphatase/predicted Zn-ribbon and HTH transcriptional regulator